MCSIRVDRAGGDGHFTVVTDTTSPLETSAGLYVRHRHGGGHRHRGGHSHEVGPVAAPEPWGFDAGTIGGPAAAMPSITLDAPITFDAGTIGGPAAAMPSIVTLPADAAITPSAGIIGGIYSDDSVRFIPQPQGAFTSGVERFPTDSAALHDVNLYNQNWRQTAKQHDGLWATEMSVPGLVNHDYDWTTGRTTIER
jgi:hypothetical protein